METQPWDDFWRPLLALEETYLATLNAWDEHDRSTGEYVGRSDRFERRTCSAPGREARAAKIEKAKALTNWAVVNTAGSALRSRQSDGVRDVFHEPCALILDGVEATTSKALLGEGFSPGRVLVPNTVPSVASSLRALGLRAWAGRLEDYLRAPLLAPLDVVYLDHCGAFPSRAWQIWSLFENGLVASGSVVACTFSTREGPWWSTPDAEDHLRQKPPLPQGWSAAHAVYSLVDTLLAAARSNGFIVEGADLNGLADYVVRSSDDTATCESVATHTSRQAADALAGRDIIEVVESLAAWSTAVLPTEGPPVGKDAGLAHQVATVVQRLRPQIGEKVLAAAWCPSDVCAGRPHAALSDIGPIRDMDVKQLYSLALRVASGHDSSDARVPPRERSHRGAGVSLRRCVLLYPEQMMFLVVRVHAKCDK